MRCYNDVIRVVVDTNVLVEGLGRKGRCGHVIDLWAARRIAPCVSTALALEYEEVLTRQGSSELTKRKALALQALLTRAEFVPISFTYRPQSPDPGDDLVIDCVMNSGAGLITSNVRDFRQAAEKLGFSLWTPLDFISALEKS